VVAPPPQTDPLPVVRAKNPHWHARHLIVESRLVGDVQQPDGQRDTCREEQYEHDQALSETGLAHRPWQRAGDLERRREPVRLRVGKDRTMARRHLAACTPRA
jgi:hypothetical protein